MKLNIEKMSEENKPLKPETESHTEEPTTSQPERTMNAEIEALAAEANETELPTEATLEAEIENDEVAEATDAKTITESSNTELPPTHVPTSTDKTSETSETEETEETATKDVKKEIPKKDYSILSKEELIAELQLLLKNEKITDIKDQAEEINTIINAQFTSEQQEAKKAFLEEGGNVIDFRHYDPLKKAFNEVYYEYRNKRSEFYQRKQKDQKANLALRQELIEEVKNLRSEIGGAESFNTTYNKFKDVQERWNNAGNIPRDRYNLVWNDYYHNVDAFYEILHLNREFRDSHYKDNLIKKLALIERAEELAADSNVTKAFKELQLLHRMWKEEIGPVSKEYSDVIWEKFSAATKKIHDARDEKQKEVEALWVQNLEVKNKIISDIETIAQGEIKSHRTLQDKMKEVEALREAFFKAGKVPKESNDATWDAFKLATRNFNHEKNDFYKSQKKEQYTNLEKKRALVKIAQDNKGNEDVTETLNLMKKIQSDWKKIGHVPRKDSDKIWKEFKDACNHFFDRMHDSKKQDRAGEEENLTKKQALLKEVKALKLEGDKSKDLATIKEHIATWKGIGRVPFKKKSIDQDFNKVLDGLFTQLDIDKKESELIKYENRMQSIAGQDDERALEKEQFFIRKKIEESKSEIIQLENNLGFFQHVPDDNPMVVEVHKNITRHKDALDLWKGKLKKVSQTLKALRNPEPVPEVQETETSGEEE